MTDVPMLRNLKKSLEIISTLDAEYSIGCIEKDGKEFSCIILMSGGGHSNRNYNDALLCILKRLRDEEISIDYIIVDSSEARKKKLSLEELRVRPKGYPERLDLSKYELEKLRRDICEAEQPIAQDDGAKTGKGAKNRTIRIQLTDNYEVSVLEKIITGNAINVIKEMPQDKRSNAQYESYSINKVAEDTFLSFEKAQKILDRLRARKAVILQGPPGCGKSFIARYIAFALMGEKDDIRIKTIQFHQSTSYEDFIQGYRPTPAGNFSLRNGSFMQFCSAAAKDGDRPWVFIIDEINRGNLSKIFGETLLLLECDKRSVEFSIPLTYQDVDSEPFSIPANVYVIGMMNTADRSLALVDYALRRRFSFITLEPAFNEPGFKRHLDECCANEKGLAMAIIQRVNDLNSKITEDITNLGPGYAIGHSYFCLGRNGSRLTWEGYRDIIDTEIAPLLREYWFDNPAKADSQISSLLAKPMA
jgi:hypothetical protein